MPKQPSMWRWRLALPQVVAVLPADEVRSHLNQIKPFLV
jgi:hypothetical protein